MRATYPTKSAHIRTLAAEGLAIAEIARVVGVRYQHARKVLIDAGMWRPQPRDAAPTVAPRPKPDLQVSQLLTSGFVRAGEWKSVGEELVFDGTLPNEAGVYAFCDETIAYYVGVATMGLSRRLYFYRKPGISQTTSIRVKNLLLEHLTNKPMQVLVVSAAVSDWNGLPVDLNAGLELGLIKHYSLAWNKRGV